MIKKIPYENAEISLIILTSPDIITTSGGGWEGPLGGNDGESPSDDYGWT